jgi:hypothetical protein
MSAQVGVHKPCPVCHQGRKLRLTRKEYKEFPSNVFVKRVNREKDKQKTAGFWAFNRNKKGMKEFLKDVAIIAQEG